jgi:hypothetical protein
MLAGYWVKALMGKIYWSDKILSQSYVQLNPPPALTEVTGVAVDVEEIVVHGLGFRKTGLSAGRIGREIDINGGIEGLDDRDQVVHIVIGKQPFDPLLMEARKGFFVELAGVHDAPVG